MVVIGDLNVLLVNVVNPVEQIFVTVTSECQRRVQDFVSYIFGFFYGILDFFIYWLALFFFTIYIRLPYLVLKYIWCDVIFAFVKNISKSKVAAALRINYPLDEYEST